MKFSCPNQFCHCAQDIIVVLHAAGIKTELCTKRISKKVSRCNRYIRITRIT